MFSHPVNDQPVGTFAAPLPPAARPQPPEPSPDLSQSSPVGSATSELKRLLNISGLPQEDVKGKYGQGGADVSAPMAHLYGPGLPMQMGFSSHSDGNGQHGAPQQQALHELLPSSLSSETDLLAATPVLAVDDYISQRRSGDAREEVYGGQANTARGGRIEGLSATGVGDAVRHHSAGPALSNRRVHFEFGADSSYPGVPIPLMSGSQADNREGWGNPSSGSDRGTGSMHNPSDSMSYGAHWQGVALHHDYGMGGRASLGMAHTLGILEAVSVQDEGPPNQSDVHTEESRVHTIGILEVVRGHDEGPPNQTGVHTEQDHSNDSKEEGKPVRRERKPEPAPDVKLLQGSLEQLVDVPPLLYRMRLAPYQRARREQRQRAMGIRLDFRTFEEDLFTLLKALEPTEEEERKKVACFKRLEHLLLPHVFVDCRLHVYGSGANSFGLRSHDLDLCLEQQGEDKLDKLTLVAMLEKALNDFGFEEIHAIPHARVPVVKFRCPVTKIDCDCCFDNLLAVANTKLLRDYAAIDPRLRQLALVIKFWAKQRGVADAYRGTLSSYAYVLLATFLLQTRSPPILPCLQNFSRPTFRLRVNEWKCDYYDQVEALQDYGRHNDESLGELLLAFFDYWNRGHDYQNSVISVRQGKLLKKHEKNWTRRIGSERHLLCIEDPFITSHDLGRVIDKHSIKTLRDEFKRASQIMRSEQRPAGLLFRRFEDLNPDERRGAAPGNDRDRGGHRSQQRSNQNNANRGGHPQNGNNRQHRAPGPPPSGGQHPSRAKHSTNRRR